MVAPCLFSFHYLTTTLDDHSTLYSVVDTEAKLKELGALQAKPAAPAPVVLPTTNYTNAATCSSPPKTTNGIKVLDEHPWEQALDYVPTVEDYEPERAEKSSDDIESVTTTVRQVTEKLLEESIADDNVTTLEDAGIDSLLSIEFHAGLQAAFQGKAVHTFLTCMRTCARTFIHDDTLLFSTLRVSSENAAP